MHFPSENRNLISLCLFFVCFFFFAMAIILVWKRLVDPFTKYSLRICLQWRSKSFPILGDSSAYTQWKGLNCFVELFRSGTLMASNEFSFFFVCVCVFRIFCFFLIKRRAAWFPWNCGCVCVLCVQSTYLWNERPWNSAGGHRGHPWRRRWRRWVWQSVVMTVVHG